MEPGSKRLRHAFLLIRLRVPPAYATQTRAMPRAGCYQGDIITAIAVGQPSQMLRPRRLPSPGPLASEPAEITDPFLKRNIAPQSGTAFAIKEILTKCHGTKCHDHDGLDHGLCLR
jgi:hypothetical protein